ncbi:hypothetical protein E4U42_003744 [Claviceps africana]|uniref:Uncharacterized protein n=1 Tax=Claviceps africana TaxID=83212 RepID=A0A8K0J688_9HYPO|nr:hypothetical protein E4U42_003744 [Claviceps africana]
MVNDMLAAPHAFDNFKAKIKAVFKKKAESKPTKTAADKKADSTKPAEAAAPAAEPTAAPATAAATTTAATSGATETKTDAPAPGEAVKPEATTQTEAPDAKTEAVKAAAAVPVSLQLEIKYRSAKRDEGLDAYADVQSALLHGLAQRY